MFPVSKPDIGKKEKEYAFDAIESGWVSSRGSYIQLFEEQFASYNGMSHGVACNSGTNALFLALKALGIKEGDEVIVPEFTMIATAWAVTYCGATPIFIDCDDRLSIRVDLIEEKINSKTKAIMPVHIYGRQCNMEKIKEIAHEYNLFIVEDVAEGHGIKPVGDIACYSFFGNKIITTGEGGMCLTNNLRLAEQIEHLRSMAFDKEHVFLHKKVGFNFRMTNVQAAIGYAQSQRLDDILAQRSKISDLYDKYLDPSIIRPKRDVTWMYDIEVQNQAKITTALKNAGIETRVFFKPMSMQPMYFNENYKNTRAFYWSQHGIYLPTYNLLTEKDIKFISSKVNENI